MSKRRTKKKKIAAQRRANARRQEIKKLEELKTTLEAKLEEQEKEKFKQFHIRNLKIVGNTCNFFIPFVLSAGVTVGIFKLFGGGVPFYLDNITKYKVYTLDFDTNAYVKKEDEYIVLDELESNSLVVYSPWEGQDSQYIRFKREYMIGTLETLDLYNAVLNGDYSYIEQNVTDYKEEIQTSNKINEEEQNDYIINASLNILDKGDTLLFSETDLRNIVITIIEVVLGIGIGGLIAWKRDFDYIFEVQKVNSNYQCIIRSLNSTKEKIEDTNQKILLLSKLIGGR